MEVFEEYLANIEDPAKKTRIEGILYRIIRTYPELKPRIAWNQPMFTHHGTFIMGFSLAKDHISVSPEKVVVDRFSDEISRSGYEHSKMLIRIPWDKPVDFSLLEKMIDFNILDKADCTTFWRKTKG